MLADMSLIRNGSMLANALLVVTGAAAGAGVTLLVSPAMRQNDETLFARAQPPPSEPSVRSKALKAPADGSASHEANAEKTTWPMNGSVDANDRAAALRDAGAADAEKDVTAALNRAAQFTSAQDRLDYLRGVYSTWAKGDPRSAVSYAMSNFAPGTLRSETVGIAVNRWGATDPRGAWQWSDQNLSGPLKEQAMTDLMIGWTRKTPEVAAQWLASTNYNSQPLINATAGTWAETNPQAAYAWASSLKNEAASRTGKIVTTSEWALQDPPAVAKQIEPELNTPAGVDLATALTNIWASTDPTAAAEWVYKLPAGDGRNEAAATLATVWAASDINGAIAWTKTIIDAEMRRQVITHIGTTWGAIEPDKALDWLATLPANETTSAIIGAYNSWAAVDAVGLNDYIQSQPVSSAMDQARLSLADVTAASDIQASIDLAFGLSSDLGRDEAVARYFRQWRKTDDASAQAWLSQSWASLSPTTQQRLAKEQARAVVAR